MATNHPIHRHTGLKAAPSSRRQTCRQRPVVLSSPRYVELDDAHEQAALGALADLLAPYLEQLRARREGDRLILHASGGLLRPTTDSASKGASR